MSKKIEELKERIEYLQNFIEIAREKMEKYACLFAVVYASSDDIVESRSKLNEYASGFSRISSLVDEAKVEIEDLELQIERLNENKEDKPKDINYYILIGL